MISQLEAAKHQPTSNKIRFTEEEFNNLCDQVTEVLKQDSTLLILQAPITVCGDVHGQFYDLIAKFSGHADMEPVSPNSKKYLFLGDYVDRGDNSLEVISYLFALKVKYPKSIWLLRGNHETREISHEYGFYDECITVYPEYGERIWEKINNVFCYLPLAAVIGDRIFCVHGGLSPGLENNTPGSPSLDTIKEIQRPIEVPDQGLVCDLLWSDPDPDRPGWNDSERGVSYLFGRDIADKFLRIHDYDLICRAHQCVENGYEFPFYPDNTVLTVFTAPNYDDSANKGAMLDINQDLMCSFTYLESSEYNDTN